MPRSTPLERTATTYLFAVAVVVPLAYITPYATRAPVSPPWIVGAAVVVSTIAALGAWRFPRRAHAGPPAASPASHGRAVATFIVAFSAALALTTFTEHTEAVRAWLPCPHQAALFLLEDGTGEGLEMYAPAWETTVNHITEHVVEPGYGLRKILRTQRIGSAATLVQHLSLLGIGATSSRRLATSSSWCLWAPF